MGEFYKTPEIICPGDFLTKAEMLGMIMAHDPKLLESFGLVLSQKGYLKKMETSQITYLVTNVTSAWNTKMQRDVAQEASVRWSEHIEYYARWHRHQRKMDNRKRV